MRQRRYGVFDTFAPDEITRARWALQERGRRFLTQAGPFGRWLALIRGLGAAGSFTPEGVDEVIVAHQIAFRRSILAP